MYRKTLTIILLVSAFTHTIISPLTAALVSWDTSATTGIQNSNGTWGTDDFWTSYTGNGTVLSGWTSGDDAFFGRNSAGASSPSGNFIITVSGPQTAASIQQPGGGSGNFSIQSGTINTSFIRADQGLFTVDSDVVGGATTLRMTGGQISLGGNNTFTSTNIIASGTPTLSLTSNGAFGSSNTSTVSSQNVTIDVIASDIDSTNLTLANGVVITKLLNSGGSSSSWGGNINSGTTAILQAGGISSQLNINGVISGGGGVNVEDNSTLRLNGANTHTTNTTVRSRSTLLVGNDSALGTSASGTFVNVNGTIDLFGSDIGAETVTLQQTNARILNSNVSTSLSSGSIVLGSTGHSIGGSGDIQLSGVISGSQGFSKVGAGTLTLSGNNTFSGDLTISQGTVVLDPSGELFFVIGASGINNTTDGVGDAILNGAFGFDLSSAGDTIGDSWMIVDTISLSSVAYGAGFSVNGFVDEGAGIWSFDSGSAMYQFSENSGTLSVVPEPSAYAIIFGLTAIGLAYTSRKKKLANIPA